MHPHLFHWHSLDTVRLLFWSALFTCSVLFTTDSSLRSSVRELRKVLLCALVLTLLWRIPLEGHFYHGIEYEDSYVYTVAARQILEHTAGSEAPVGFPYSISTCDVGSLLSCSEWQSFPEHLIGTAYVFSAYSRVVGYSPDAGAWVAVCAACISCFLVVLVAWIITGDSVSAAGAAIIFAATPIFAVQGLESSAEPLSNAAISMVLFLLAYLQRYFSVLGVFRASVAWLALILSVAFAMTVKRENALLVIAVPLSLLMLGTRHFTTPRRRYSHVIGLLSVAIVCGLFAWHLNIAGTSGGELSLLDQFRPTLSTVIGIALSFLQSLLVLKWYLCGFVFVIWGIIASSRQRLPSTVTLIFLGYLALYAFHIRGYYELFSRESDPRAALRFEMNLMSLWSVLGGIGGAAAVSRIRFSLVSRRKWAVGGAGWVVLLALLALSYAVTRALRAEGVEDEARVRVDPAMKAVGLASSLGSRPGYVITFEPLVVQMYADPATNVLDIDAIGREGCKLGQLAGTSPAIFIDEDIHHSAADAIRYSAELLSMSHFMRKPVYRGAGFRIATISDPPKGNTAPCRD